jgi:hypothetical protein
MGLTWDGASSTTTPPTASQPGSVVYLSYLNGALDPASTLAGNWPGVIGTAPNYNGTDDPTNDPNSSWQVLSTAVLRMEICFLLKDGTLSTMPVTNPSSTNNNLGANTPPLVTSDSTSPSPGPYATGSRWFDTTAKRGYICVNNTPGAAVWNAIGTQDISGVVVAIAVLDDTSRKIISTSALSTLAAYLPDVTAANLNNAPPTLMKQTWESKVQSPTFASTIGIPTAVASHVRVYQRYFYLNGP